MSRRLPARMTRSQKVRADSDILREGAGEDYGWVSNYAYVGGTLGDYDPGGNRPSWWVGDDAFDGRPIGPHGPVDESGTGTVPWGPASAGVSGGYGWDNRSRLPHGAWWNTPLGNGVSLLPAVTRCTTIIVNPIIRTTWIMEDRDGKVKDLPLWIRDPQLLEAAPGDGTAALNPAGHRLTEHSFWATVLTHALWWGRGVFMYIEGASGSPLPGTFHILNPYQVANRGGRWVLDPHGEEPLITDHDGRFQLGGQTWRIAAVRGLPPNNEHTPEGVLLRHFNTLRLGAAIHKYTDGTFSAGIPAGYLKVMTPNYDETVATKLRDEWLSRHGQGRRSIAVLNSMVDFVPISITPVDSNVAEVKRGNLIDIAHAFGLSAAFLDTGDGSLTYANITDRRRELVDIVLSAWAQQLTETISSLLPYGTRIRVHWPAFTAPDLSEQMPVMIAGVQAGLLSREEARGLMGLPADTPGQPLAQMQDGTPTQTPTLPAPGQEEA